MEFFKAVVSKSTQIINTFKRFTLPSTLIICLYILLTILTLSSISTTKCLSSIEITLNFGIIFCVFSQLIYEKYFQKKFQKKQFQILIWFVSLCISLIPYLLLEIFNYNYEYVILGLTGVSISFLIIIFYFSVQESISKTFSYIFKNILFSFFVSAIIFIGGSLCIFAFQNLIYNSTPGLVYSLLGEFVGILLFLHLCLTALPDKNRELTIPKVFKIIIFNAAFPIYMVLLTILYTYLFKILFTWTFPSNQINWFVSISLLLYIFFVFALKQYKNENKILKLFLNYFGYAMIPMIIMQFLAIYIRVFNYGLTALRYVSSILNIFALIFTVLTLPRKKEKFLKQSLIIFSSFVLVMTITPLNLIDVPTMEQAHRLKQLLLSNEMLDGNKIIPNDTIPNSEKKKIMSAYKYLKQVYGTLKEKSHVKVDFLPAELVNSKKNIFGFTDKEYNDIYYY